MLLCMCFVQPPKQPCTENCKIGYLPSSECWSCTVCITETLHWLYRDHFSFCHFCVPYKFRCYYYQNRLKKVQYNEYNCPKFAVDAQISAIAELSFLDVRTSCHHEALAHTVKSMVLLQLCGSIWFCLVQSSSAFMLAIVSLCISLCG